MMVADDHPSAAALGAGRLRLVLALTGLLVVVEVAGGLLTGSLALIADAGHMLTDVAGIAMALLAIHFAARPPTPGHSYGYYRLEILAAVAKGVLLFGVAGYILLEVYHRLGTAPVVLGLPMLAVAVVGLLVNVISAALLLGGQRRSLTLRGAFNEVLGDMIGSGAVVVAGVIILLSGWVVVDLVASVLIGVLILPRTWHLLRDAADILLESTPKGIDLTEVRRHIVETDGVAATHDLHAWTITSGLNVLSAHIVLTRDARPGIVLDELCRCLSSDFDIEHSTFQLEPSDRRPLEAMTH